jgi:hypothetical protein
MSEQNFRINYWKIQKQKGTLFRQLEIWLCYSDSIQNWEHSTNWWCLFSEKSGHGILEFSTDKAGQDVTPLNLEFGEEDKQQHKSSSGALNSIAGMFCTA